MICPKRAGVAASGNGLGNTETSTSESPINDPEWCIKECIETRRIIYIRRDTEMVASHNLIIRAESASINKKKIR